MERKACCLSKWMVQNGILNPIVSWLPTGGLYVVTAALGPASQECFYPGMTLSLTPPLSRGLDTLLVIGSTRVTLVLCIGDSVKFVDNSYS